MSVTQLDDQRLENLISRQQIEDLLYAYCRGVDRGDAELLSSIFHEDSNVVSGVFDGPGKQFARDIVNEVNESSVRVFHSIKNIWVKIKGDSAISECYVLAVQTVDAPDGRIDILVGGRYLDEYERRNGEWAILQHTFVLDWNMFQPCTAKMDEGFFGAMPKGQRGQRDPVYSLWGQF